MLILSRQQQQQQQQLIIRSTKSRFLVVMLICLTCWVLMYQLSWLMLLLLPNPSFLSYQYDNINKKSNSNNNIVMSNEEQWMSPQVVLTFHPQFPIEDVVLAIDPLGNDKNSTTTITATSTTKTMTTTIATITTHVNFTFDFPLCLVHVGKTAGSTISCGLGLMYADVRGCHENHPYRIHFIFI
jgi:hypothetical protein